jgi:hypothetical protein
MNELVAIETIGRREKLTMVVRDSVSSPITKYVVNMAVLGRASQKATVSTRQRTISVLHFRPEGGWRRRVCRSSLYFPILRH